MEPVKTSEVTKGWREGVMNQQNTHDFQEGDT
jgi:hypothetical protein